MFSIKTHLPSPVGVTEGDIDTAVVMNIEVEVEGSAIVMEDSQVPVNSLIAEVLGDGCTGHCAVSIVDGNDTLQRYIVY